MCFKPNRADGREKLDRWEKERGHEGRTRDPVSRNVRPRGNQDPDARDLKRSVERFEALLGR
jgi:hypothetical protein